MLTTLNDSSGNKRKFHDHKRVVTIIRIPKLDFISKASELLG